MSNAADSMNKDTAHRYIDGYISLHNKTVPRIKIKLSFSDYWGAFKVRWSFGRMNYLIAPGLYAAGDPDNESPVLVSANYKLTFDTLRKRLSGLNAWILILDTKGVNVWCAAGKGTFGTNELVKRILKSGLFDVVTHRKVIIPQLGAPGISAHVVMQQTGFRVLYGPVRASDIIKYLDNGMIKDAKMSRVYFPILDRIVLVPLELVGAKKYFLILALLSLGAGILSEGVSSNALVWMSYMLGGLFCGAALTPILLPYIPVKSFSLKGGVVGLLTATLITYLAGFSLHKAVPLSLITVALSGYAALQFTGASTYTSENGVRKEIKFSLPILYTTLGLGVALSLVYITVSLIKKGGISL
jgi:hypothetical protein